MAAHKTTEEFVMTQVLPVKDENLGYFSAVYRDGIRDLRSIDTWNLPETLSPSFSTLKVAASHLKHSNIPVAFPTETVYGLGADATRSEAVKGIYKAKGRPSDNPLIIHVCDLDMLRGILTSNIANGYHEGDLIPSIYKPLIDKFWPGPLTILLRNPTPSILAPEVTAGLKTFGVRMPDSALALTLIKLAGIPVAAPSANTSTKPSPTTAQHVFDDLNGSVEYIVDGGPCDVGVESTVVDGLCDPPVILRPGGLSIESIRTCKGWEGVVKAYKDGNELSSAAPRAPGMKYKHYSPKAKVILFENGASVSLKDIPEDYLGRANPDGHLNLVENGSTVFPTGHVSKIGIVRTSQWRKWLGWNEHREIKVEEAVENPRALDISNDLYEELQISFGELRLPFGSGATAVLAANLVDVQLGPEIKRVAHYLFSVLREMDRLGVDVIFVEGIYDQGDIAAAVMNRLRKAASEIRTKP